MSVPLAAILLAVHVLYLLILPTASSKTIAAVGALVAATLAAAPTWRRFRQRGVATAGEEVPTRWSVGLLPFALPLLSFLGSATVTFYRLDARSLLVIAWMVSVLGLIALSPDPPAGGRRRLPILTRLFIIWSGLFWLTVIWDVGVGRAVAEVSREERLVTTFRIFETRPASEHLFLVWLSPEAFRDGVAYSNHLHPITLFFYACSKLVHLVTGLPFYVGRNLTPFVMSLLGIAAFAALLPRPSRRLPQGLAFHGAVFLAIGFCVTDWHFWVYAFTWNFDTVFPVIAYLLVLVWATAYPRLSRRNARQATVAMVVLALFGWLYTPLVVLATWVAFGRLGGGLRALRQRNAHLVRASVVALIVGMIVYTLPLILIAAKGYDNASSTFVFRSGLDGDTRYFQSVAQAVLHPFREARSSWSLLLPLTPLALAAACAGTRRARRRLLAQGAFLITPYLFSLATAPQSVSIHPNLYDMLLVLPLAVMGTTSLLAHGRNLAVLRPVALVVSLIAVILIMANLIGIAQGFHRLSG